MYSNLLFSLSLFIYVGNNFQWFGFFEVLGGGKGLRAGYILLKTVCTVFVTLLCYSVLYPVPSLDVEVPNETWRSGCMKISSCPLSLLPLWAIVLE